MKEESSVEQKKNGDIDRYVSSTFGEWEIQDNEIRFDNRDLVPRTNGFRGVCRGYHVIIFPIPDDTSDELLQKMKLLRDVEHPSIKFSNILLKVWGLYHDVSNGKRFLVSDMPLSSNLKDVVYNNSLHFSFHKKKIRWASQLLEIIQFLNTREPPIFGLDINPYSIYVTEGWKLKIFPFANKFLFNAPEIDFIRYEAPEQISGSPMDCYTDSSNWAITIFELLTKIHPYGDAENIEVLKEKIVGGEKNIIPDFVCPYLIQILERCWGDSHFRPIPRDILKNDFEAEIFKENYKFSIVYWGTIWEKISEDQHELEWGPFLKNFCQFFKFSLNLKSEDYDCLKYAFTSSTRLGKVTKEDFSFAIHWITDAIYPGWSVVKSISNNVKLNWYYINATTAEESKFVSKRHQFMVRYSQRNDSLLIVFMKTKGKGKKQYVHNKIDNPYVLYKRVKRAQKKT